MAEKYNRENEPKETRPPQADIFCQWCGRQIPADSVYCEVCGQYLPNGTESSADAGSFLSTGKGRLIPVVLAVFFLVCIVLAMENRESGKKETLFYIKDNSIYGMKLEKRTGERTEFSPRYLEEWSSRSDGGLLRGRPPGNGLSEPAPEAVYGGTVSGTPELTSPAYSADGRYLFYPEQGAEGSFDLNRTDLKKEETRTLDAEVVEFHPMGEGQVIYKKENQSLFFYDGARKTRLTAKAGRYQVSEAGDAILWTTDEDGMKDIYYLELSGKREAIRLERGAELLDASPDLRMLLMQKEDIIYRMTAPGNKEELAAEVTEAAQGDAAEGTFYFVRDVIRTPNSSYKELYYYSGGEAKLLDDSFREILWQDDGVLLYMRTGKEKDSILAVGEMNKELGCEIALPKQSKRDGENLYFLSPDEAAKKNESPTYELCYAKLSGKNFGRVETIDRGVSEIGNIINGKAYYLKALVNEIGDLYCDGELLAYEVAAGSVAEIPGAEGVLCIADCAASRKRGTLMLFRSGEGRRLADEVYGYSATSETDIRMLANYNHEKGRGDLLQYNATETETVDKDVWAYYTIGSSGVCR